MKGTREDLRSEIAIDGAERTGRSKKRRIKACEIMGNLEIQQEINLGSTDLEKFEPEER